MKKYYDSRNNVQKIGTKDSFLSYYTVFILYHIISYNGVADSHTFSYFMTLLNNVDPAVLGLNLPTVTGCCSFFTVVGVLFNLVL